MKVLTPRCAMVLAATLAGSSSLHAQAAATPAQASPAQVSPAQVTPAQAATPQVAPVAGRTLAAAAVPGVVQEPGSGVRIVRLSQTRGQVELDRNIDRGFEAAFTNMPITEHARIKTGEGVAEIEFEDNSTLRLTPNTVVDFPQLRRSAAGTTLSTVHVVQGLVYVSLSNAKGNAFTVAYGQRQLALEPSAHVQLSVGAAESRLAVLDGAVALQNTSGTTVSNITKKHSLFLDPASEAPPSSIAKLEKTPYDDWDKTAVDYHKQYAQASNFGAASPSYGTSDMNYYGSFVTLGGCGSVWRPYFASAGWDPFANGVMAYYGGGAGYSYVSPYPWGWTPYHSGQWQSCGANGWGWTPGGSFVGIANAVKFHRPLPASGQPLPVTTTHASIVALNGRPLSVSQTTSPSTFAFRQDSAGLGVPRELFGKLSDLSTTVQHQGSLVVSASAPKGLVPTRSERQSTSSAATSMSSGMSALSSFQQAPGRSSSNAGMSAPSHGNVSAPSSGGASSGGGGHH